MTFFFQEILSGQVRECTYSRSIFTHFLWFIVLCSRQVLGLSLKLNKSSSSMYWNYSDTIANKREKIVKLRITHKNPAQSDRYISTLPRISTRPEFPHELLGIAAVPDRHDEHPRNPDTRLLILIDPPSYFYAPGISRRTPWQSTVPNRHDMHPRNPGTVWPILMDPPSYFDAGISRRTAWHRHGSRSPRRVPTKFCHQVTDTYRTPLVFRTRLEFPHELLGIGTVPDRHDHTSNAMKTFWCHEKPPIITTALGT